MADSDIRRVYVIELTDDAGPRDHERFCNLYVGETGASIRKRYKAHRRGGLYAANVVTEHRRRLRPDLYRGLPSYQDRAASERGELAHARSLRDLGYRVYTNGGWLSPAPSPRAVAGADLCPPQLTRLERAISETVGACSRALTPSLCAHILWGSRGNEIASWGSETCRRTRFSLTSST
jgi:hypothetical protein